MEFVCLKEDRVSPRLFFTFPWAKSHLDFYKGEVRPILCEHFGFPWPPVQYWQESVRTACSLCTCSKAVFWCVECRRRMCPGCVARQHHPGSLTVLHSIEKIIVDRSGVKLLSPILGEVLLTCFAGYLLTNVRLSPDQLSSFNMCPTASFARRVLAAFDAKVLYYFRKNFVDYCGIEDAFYSLFVEAWIRNIVTDSDDTLMVVITLVPAMMFRAVMSMIAVPVAALLFAVLMTIVRLVEVHLIPVNPFTLWLQSVVASADVISLFQGRADVPPRTTWRIRPSKDSIDKLRYMKTRVTRQLSFFYDSTQADLRYFASKAIFMTVCFRLVCIWADEFIGVKPGMCIRSILCSIGFRNKIEQQFRWYDGATNYFGDNFLMAQLARGLGFAHGFARFFSSIPVFFCLLPMIPVGFLLALIDFLVRERREFKSAWNGATKAVTVGVCGSACTCAACVVWDIRGKTA